MGNKIFIIFAVVLLVFGGVKLYNRYGANNIAEKEIRTDIKVILYSKDGCRYCYLAKELLQDKGIPYEVVELTNNKDIFIKLANQTCQNTVPYIFVNDKFIGGYQDLLKLSESSKL